jgi:hypothetical protein
MEAAMSHVWMASMLASLVFLIAAASVTVVRVWPRKPELSPEEWADLEGAPAPALQRRAWLGVAIGVASLAAIAAIVITRGVLAFEESDQVRLVVLGIFLAGLIGSALSVSLPVLRGQRHQALDERDRAVLVHAPLAQVVLMIVGLTAWVIALSERFHDDGAVPLVYLNLIFGSIVLLMVVGLPTGILLGYLFQAYDAEG